MIDLSQVGMELATLYIRAKLVKTKSEFRRMVEQGAVKVNGHKVVSPFARLAIAPDKKVYLVDVAADDHTLFLHSTETNHMDKKGE